MWLCCTASVRGHGAPRACALAGGFVARPGLMPDSEAVTRMNRHVQEVPARAAKWAAYVVKPARFPARPRGAAAPAHRRLQLG